MTATAVVTEKAVTVAKSTLMVDLPDELSPFFDRLSNAKYAKSEAEREIKECKEEILKHLPAPVKDVKYVLRVLGVIRASLRLGHRPNASVADLLAGFPEAYEACVKDTEFPVLDPA